MKSIKLVMTCAVVARMVFVPAASGDPGDEGRLAEQKRLLVIASEGYRENRTSFRTIVCRFRITDAMADSEGEALAGRMKITSSHECQWTVNGNKLLYEELCDESLYKNTLLRGLERKEKEVSVPCFPSSRLSDGSIHLTYSPVMKTGNLREPSNAGRGVDVTPFNIGGSLGDYEQYNPFAVISKVFKGDLTCLGLRQKMIDGEETISVSVGNLPSQPHYDYTFSVSHSYLLKGITIYSDSIVVARGYVTDVKKCAKEHWFPMRSIIICGKEPPFFVKEVKVLNLDVENAPEEEAFALEMPEGSRLVNPSDMRSVIEFRTNRRVTLEDLPNLLKKCQQALERRIKGDPQANIITDVSEHQHNRVLRPRRNFWLFLSSAGFVCLLIGIAFQRKMKRGLGNEHDAGTA